MILRLALTFPEDASYLSLPRALGHTQESLDTQTLFSDDVETALTELYDTVLSHARTKGGRFAVTLDYDAERLIVLVEDRGQGFSFQSVPVLGPLPADACDSEQPGRFGLRLVAALSGRLDFYRVDDAGTQIRAEKALASRTKDDRLREVVPVGAHSNVTEEWGVAEFSQQRTRLLALSADVGRALTTHNALADMLRGCAEALVEHIDAVFARIWTLNNRGDTLELKASAGLYTHLDGPHGRVPVGQFKIGLIAQERKPHLTNSVVGDARVSDQEWAAREGIIAFAGYPLVIEDQLVGVIALFARQPLSDAILQALEAVADQIAVGIDRKRAEVALSESEALKGSILEAALDCIITIDDQGRVVEWNPAAERTFGYARTQAMGQILAELIVPASLRGAHGQGIATYLATGEGAVLNRRIEVPALHADGREFPVELTAVPIVMGGRTLFTAYLRDLTERERGASQQQAFLRDVLLSVTEGRLHLCHSPSDLPILLPTCGEPVPISRTGGIAELRGQARRAAVTHSFADERWQDLMTATSEAAMNAAVHGGGGQGRVCGSTSTIQVWVEDQGTGIDVASLPQATLEKGFSSVGTLGHGMKMMLSTADRVWLLTGSTGTTVVLEQDRLPPIPTWLRA